MYSKIKKQFLILLPLSAGKFNVFIIFTAIDLLINFVLIALLCIYLR